MLTKVPNGRRSTYRRVVSIASIGGPILPLASIVDRSYIPRMCNDYEQHVQRAEYRKVMRALEAAGAQALEKMGPNLPVRQHR
jgi:hypothetical protein